MISMEPTLVYVVVVIVSQDLYPRGLIDYTMPSLRLEWQREKLFRVLTCMGPAGEKAMKSIRF